MLERRRGVVHVCVGSAVDVGVAQVAAGGGGGTVLRGGEGTRGPEAPSTKGKECASRLGNAHMIIIAVLITHF